MGSILSSMKPQNLGHNKVGADGEKHNSSRMFSKIAVHLFDFTPKSGTRHNDTAWGLTLQNCLQQTRRTIRSHPLTSTQGSTSLPGKPRRRISKHGTTDCNFRFSRTIFNYSPVIPVFLWCIKTWFHSIRTNFDLE